jgi:hypothetical protein
MALRLTYWPLGWRTSRNCPRSIRPRRTNCTVWRMLLVHRSPFLPTVGSAAFCRHADPPPGQRLGDSVGGDDEPCAQVGR